MQQTVIARSQRRWLSAAIVGALAFNSMAASAAPFAYIPEANKSNGALSNFFVRVDLSNVNAPTTSPIAPIAVINNPTADPRTVFSGVAFNDVTGQLFIADHGNAKGVLQVDTRGITTTGPASIQATVYTTGGDPKGLTTDRSGKHVFVATDDGQTVTIINTNPGPGETQIQDVEFKTTSTASGPAPADVRLNLSGTTAYVSDQSVDQRVCRFNAVSPPFTAKIPDSDCVFAGSSIPGDFEFGSAQLNSVAVSPDATRVYVLGHGDDSITAIDVTNATMQTVNGRGVQPGTGNLNGIAIDPSGKFAYATNNLGHLYVLDLVFLDTPAALNPPTPPATTTPVVVRDFAPGNLGQLQGVSITPDGKSLLLTDATISGFHLIEIAKLLPGGNPVAADVKDVAVPGG